MHILRNILRTALLPALLAAPTAAQFSAPYEVAGWTFSESGANDDGSVDTSGAPAQIVLTGGNNGSGDTGVTRYTIPSQGSGLFAFTWEVEHPDPGYDIVGFTIGGEDHFVTDFPGDGAESVLVDPGETIGFYIETLDNDLGAPTLTVTLFAGPDTDPWDDLGGAIPGSSGQTLCWLTGSLEAEPISIRVQSGPASGLVFLILSFTEFSVPFKGGVMVPDPAPENLLSLILDVNGALYAIGDWPPGVPADTEFHGQLWYADVGAVQGFAASDGFRGTTP